MNIVVVYNSRSGSAHSRDELEKSCAQAGITVDAFIAVEDGFEEQLKQYITKDQVIAVVGGDGTISSAARLLVGSQTVLAPLPGGTLNHFTKDLGISQDIDEALRHLLVSKPQAVDTAAVNNVTFINNSSIGLYPSSLQVREELQSKKITKWLAMIVASARALARYRTYTVTIDEKSFKTPFLFVGNNDYHVTDSTPGRTHFSEGLLSVYTIAAASRWTLVKILARALMGQLSTAQEFKHWNTAELTIHTKRANVSISRDGELERLATPLEYSTSPKSLIVLGVN